MKTTLLISLALCCLTLTQSANANTYQSSKNLTETKSTNSQASSGESWFCDHWPEACNEVCEYGSSPWGPYKICKLRAPWYSIPTSSNPYVFAGLDHNHALE